MQNLNPTVKTRFKCFAVFSVLFVLAGAFLEGCKPKYASTATDSPAGRPELIATEGTILVSAKILGDATVGSYYSALDTNPITATLTIDPGTYEITFSSVDIGVFDSIAGSLISPQATAENGANANCSVSSWTGKKATVKCYQTGSPANSTFNFTLIGYYPSQPNSTASIIAFALADQETAGGYTVDPNHSYNLSGDSITISASVSGVYTVNFGLLDVSNSSIQVSSHGATANLCNVASTTTHTITVQCYNTAVSPALTDTKFSISVAKVSAIPGTAKPMAYASQEDFNGHSYSAWFTDPRTSVTDIIGSATSLGGGQYQIDFIPASINSNPSLVQVSKGGSTGGADYRCSVVSWNSASIFVNCYTSAGSLADNEFIVTVLQAP